MMVALMGMIFVAAGFLLPYRLHKASGEAEAAALARNINDAARQVMAAPSNEQVRVSFSLPDTLGDKRYAIAFWGGRIWVALEDGRVFNYSSSVAGSDIFYGGDVITLYRYGNSVVASR